MTADEIINLRAAIQLVERNGPNAKSLYAYEEEYLAAPDGISVIVPVYNGATEMTDLLLSLRHQTLARDKFEVIFSLNGCSDASRALVDAFAESSGVGVRVLESAFANVARARNEALERARFKLTTFVDHDDHLSRNYLEECVALGDYRSVVVSNILKVVDGMPAEDYAQTVIAKGFESSSVHAPSDIALCYRGYTLNAIKTAPTYMLRRVRYDESLPHSEDVKYWRDVFHAFTPITVKSPSRRDIYFRTVSGHSLSHRDHDFYAKAKPRFAILDMLQAQSARFTCDSPQRKFDKQLKQLLLLTLFNLGKVAD